MEKPLAPGCHSCNGIPLQNPRYLSAIAAMRIYIKTHGN